MPGDPVTITYIAYPRPTLQTTINTVQLTENNNGADETGSFTVCNSATDNFFFTQFADITNVTPSANVKVIQQFSRTNVAFGPADGVFPVSAYGTPFNRNVALVDPHHRVH